MYSEEEIRRLTWQSRRGMLELDILFVGFMEKRFASLSEDDQKRFVDLLACEDQDLFMWLMEREVPDDPEVARIVQVVLEHARST